uniref:Cyclin-dependent kinase inhibitor domain-containing protein n=1 Tax=Panagrolaimus superbus TaxID=310955 RepID=A0A914YVP2_9BILA
MSAGIVMSSTAKKSSAKRCLFGKSSSSGAEEDTFCSRLLEQIINKKCQEWEFDFSNGVPFPSSSTFEYTQVPSGSVPGFYRCSTLAGTSNNKLGRQTSDSSISSDSENYDPSSSMATDLDSSMEFEEDINKSFRLPSKATSTPKKVIFQRQPRFGSKKVKTSSTSSSSRKHSRTLASPNDGKLTSHMPLHVSKRIVKKSVANKTSSSLSSSAAINFIFNEVSAATTGRSSTTSNHHD